MRSVECISFAFKSLRRYSTRRLFCAMLLGFIKYFKWVFTSAFFIKYIVYAVEQKQSMLQMVEYVLGVGVLLCILGMVVSYVQNMIYPIEQVKIFDGIYKEIYSKAVKVDLHCFENSDFYSKYTLALDQADKKIEAVADHMAGIIFGAIGSISIISIMLQIDAFLLLFLVFPLLGTFFFGKAVNRKYYEKHKGSIHADKVMNYVNRVMYLSKYAKDIRTTNIFNVISKQYEEATLEKIAVNKKYAPELIKLNFWKITLTFTSVFEGVLLYAMYCNVVKNTISFADLTVLTGIMVSTVWMLTGLFEDINNLNKTGVFIENILEFLNYQEKIEELQSGIIPDREIKSIIFKNVSFAYDGKSVLHNVSFEVSGGKTVAVVGGNGAGKSTLIKLLLRYYDPTEGTIFVNGIDIREYDLRSYRDLFAVAFQDSKIWGTTVRKNVLMGTMADDERVWDSLEKAGLSKRIGEMKDGLDTVMTKEFDDTGVILSGGEQQKLCVARALIRNSPIYIFDEPSSALDPIAEYDLFNNILEHGKEKIMFIISHRLSSTRNADHILMVSEGKICEQGAYEELMHSDGKYSQMYKKQAHEYWPISDVE